MGSGAVIGNEGGVGGNDVGNDVGNDTGNEGRGVSLVPGTGCGAAIGAIGVGIGLGGVVNGPVVRGRGSSCVVTTGVECAGGGNGVVFMGSGCPDGTLEVVIRRSLDGLSLMAVETAFDRCSVAINKATNKMTIAKNTSSHTHVGIGLARKNA